MATQRSTIDFLENQLRGLGTIRSRKMFGEYALYCNEKVVAFVCDDQLYVKITEANKHSLEDGLELAPPYPGAKDYLLIPEEKWENVEWLSGLIAKTAESLPLPTVKKKPKR